MSSAVASAIARYSDSVLDQATNRCLREHQDIRFEPKKIVYPLVDLQPSGQLAQSASEYAVNKVDDERLMFRP